ncbi:diacylglycerol kinase, partial [Campylobacter coli]
EGILALLKNEMAFRLELCVIIPAIVFSFFLDVSFLEHLFLITILILILLQFLQDDKNCLELLIEAGRVRILKSYNECQKLSKDADFQKFL